MDDKPMQGISPGYMAFIIEDHVEVLDEDGDALFTLPLLIPQIVNAAIAAYEKGFDRGARVGEGRVQSRIRAALGIDSGS